MVEPLAGGALDELNQLVSDPLVTIVARLAKGPTSLLDRVLTLDDLAEANFPGYAAIQLTADLNDAIELSTYGELTPQRCEWIAGTITAAQSIVGVYYTKSYDGGPEDLITVVPFDEPQFINYTGQVFGFEATLVAAKRL